MEAYFTGKKDLFANLAIGKLENEWKEYPVLHFDLNAKKFDSFDDLYDLIGRQLERYEQKYVTEAVDKSLDGRFYNLIMTIAEMSKKQVVILVDEYDKPLLQAILDHHCPALSLQEREAVVQDFLNQLQPN